MLGAEGTAKIGAFNAEATDAILPGPPGTMARMTGGNVVFDRGDKGRFSVDLIHVLTNGDPVLVPNDGGQPMHEACWELHVGYMEAMAKD